MACNKTPKPGASPHLTERKRKAPRWADVFLNALERTGLVRAAALEAGIDFITAYQWRKAHPAFLERWEAALTMFAAAEDQARTEEVARFFAASTPGEERQTPLPFIPRLSGG